MITTIGCIRVNATTTGIINEITVNVREKASIDSSIIMTVTEDDKVEILEKTGDWYKIDYKNKQGYVYADFVTINEKSSSKIQENTKLESEDNEVTATIQPKLQLKKNTGVKIAPTIQSNIIYTTTEDETIEILEEMTNWSYIEVNGIRGWVRETQISEVETKAEQKEQINEENSNQKENTQKAYVKYDNVNMRKEPSTDAAVIEKLKLNTEVIIVEEVDNVWNKVTVNGKTGYISKELLSSDKVEEKEEQTTTSRDGQETKRKIETNQEETNKETVKESKTTETKKTVTTKTITASAKGEEVVAYAKQYLGYAYTYGGASPKTGFDCSGFTSYVYKHFGYTLSRASTAQANQGTKVEKKDLQPGDLVIFKNRSLTKIGHVGIYIGNNKMIHASEPGVGVIITDIDSKSHKYPERFVMGRRIIK